MTSIGQRVRRKATNGYWRLNKRIWASVPDGLRQSRAARSYGAWLHESVCRSADREMYLGTFFLRNRPALELMRRLIEAKPSGSAVRIAVLGCSVGVEVYSIIWTLRRARPDLRLVVRAVDISPEALRVAEAGVYGPEISEMVHASIFERLTSSELAEMFDWHGDQARVKSWLREGITWELGDAFDPDLVATLGPQDLVVASNFLCHMDPVSAETCLRNLARLASPGGHVFVMGVDLDVRAKVARNLDWEPVQDLLPEIHDGDPSVRADWPWEWWGLEPLDRSRPDWQVRYACAFRAGRRGDPGQPAPRMPMSPPSDAPPFPGERSASR